MHEEGHDKAAIEFFLERTAIRIVDGGMKPFLAERLAAVDTTLLSTVRYQRAHGHALSATGRSIRER